MKKITVYSYTCICMYLVTITSNLYPEEYHVHPVFQPKKHTIIVTEIPKNTKNITAIEKNLKKLKKQYKYEALKPEKYYKKHIKKQLSLKKLKNPEPEKKETKKELEQRKLYEQKILEIKNQFYSKDKKKKQQILWTEARNIYQEIPEFNPEFREIVNLRMKKAIKYANIIDNIKQKLYNRELREKWSKKENFKTAQGEFNRAKIATQNMPTYLLHITKLLKRPLKYILKYARKIDCFQDMLLNEKNNKKRKTIVKKALKKTIFYLPEYDPYFLKTIKKSYPKIFNKAKKNYELKEGKK